MGGVGDFLFGKKPKPEKSESGNLAWDLIKNTYSPAMGYTTTGGNAAASLLGLGGSGGGGSASGGGGKAGSSPSLAGGGGGTTDQGSALSNWANSGGMKFLLDEGTDAVNSNFYSRGLGESGAAMKGLEKYRSGLASTYLQQYMDNLFKLSNLGLQAGGLVTSAGQYSKGTGQQAGKAGALPSLIQGAAMIPGISDVRLKSDIKHLYTRKDGLRVYEYTLFGKRRKGVVAHEVKQVVPEAYIPNFAGHYDGVDYSKIGTI